MRFPTAILLLGLVGLLALPAMAEPQEKEDLSTLKKMLAEGLQKPNINKASHAIVKIAGLNTKEAVRFLITVGLRVEKYPHLDEHDKVRIFRAARESIPKVTDEKARKYLFKEAQKLKRPQDSPKKVFLTEIIGKMEGQDAEEALIAIVSQRKIPPAQIMAIEALGRRRCVAAVEPLIEVFERREKNPDPVWKAAAMSLVEITGHNFHTAADWKNFWAVRKEMWDPEKHRGDAKAGGVKTREKTVPTFFDEQIFEKRVVFIIDISKSMHVKDPAEGGEQPRGAPGGKKGKAGDRCPVCGERHRGIGLPDSRMRVERVKKELIRMLDTLNADTKFNILAFSTDVLPWAGGDELLQATEVNVTKAKRFVEGLTFEEYTSTDFALERAFAHREAMAFYLLSDGTPYRDREPLPKEPIMDMVRMENKTRKVKIFTFGFSEEADKDFLTKLATENGGNFKAIK